MLDVWDQQISSYYEWNTYTIAAEAVKVLWLALDQDYEILLVELKVVINMSLDCYLSRSLAVVQHWKSNFTRD